MQGGEGPSAESGGVVAGEKQRGKTGARSVWGGGGNGEGRRGQELSVEMTVPLVASLGARAPFGLSCQWAPGGG